MLVNGFKMMVSFGVIILMMFAYKVHVSINVLWVFPLIGDLFLFTFGVGCIMMHYGVWFRCIGRVVRQSYVDA